MLIRTQSGFPRYEQLVEKLKNLPLAVNPTYVEKYRDQWRTARVSKKALYDIPLTLEIRDVSNTKLASFSRGVERDIEMISGEWSSPAKEGKEYVFGREPVDQYGGSLYYLSIKPDGRYNKRNTGIAVDREVSRIHFYVKSLNNEIEIARLGITPINLVFSDGSNVLL